MLKCRKQSKIINKMIQNPHTSFDHLTYFKVISKWCTVLSLYRCYQVRNLIISNRTCDIIRSKKRINNQRITKLLKRVSIIKYIKGQWSQKMFFLSFLQSPLSAAPSSTTSVPAPHARMVPHIACLEPADVHKTQDMVCTF